MFFLVITVLLYILIFVLCVFELFFYNPPLLAQMLIAKSFLVLGVIFSVYHIQLQLSPIIQYYKGKEQYVSTNDALVVGKNRILWTDIDNFYLYRKNLVYYIAVNVKADDKCMHEGKALHKLTLRQRFQSAGEPLLIRTISSIFSKEDILKNLEYDLQKHLKKKSS